MLVISGLTLGAQAAGLASQLVFSFTFGASAETDALFAALALPTYVTAVLVSSLAVAFIPIFIDRRSRNGVQDAVDLANGLVNVVALGLTAMAIVGMLFADQLIALTAPGLPSQTAHLASQLAVILWPSIVASGLLAVFTAMWQVEHRFAWSTLAPIAGSLVNALLTFILGMTIGIVGAAVALMVGLWLQVLLLAPSVARRWRPTLGLHHPGLRVLLAGAVPLILAGLAIKASAVLERYLGSDLPPGELSHLTYASRIVFTLGALLSSGPAAVMLPRMAEDVATLDYAGLRSRTGTGLRRLWFVAAPLIFMLIALSEPAVRILFERGAFTREDSSGVASLVRVYALSLVVVALGAVTGRAIYALRATRLIALIGTVEGTAYVLYTVYLARQFGAAGIAGGFTVYMFGSLGWQLIYLRRRLHGSGASLIRSVIPTTIVAGAAGLCAWLAAGVTDLPVPSLLAGLGAGLSAYAFGTAIMHRATLLRFFRQQVLSGRQG